MTGKRSLVFVAVLGIAALALTAGVVSGAGDTEVSVEPADENVSVGGTQTFDIVVENATDDVKGYDFNISLSNANAEIVGASPNGEPADFNTDISEDGSTVGVDAIWTTDGTVFDSDSPTILTVEVQGAQTGQTELNTDLATSTGEYNELLAGPSDEYTVTASNPASITVEESGAPTLPQGQGPAQDLDGDGAYEDVNGDGQFSLIDVGILFQNRDSDAVTNNPGVFDFSGEGEFSLVDIGLLFNQL